MWISSFRSVLRADKQQTSHPKQKKNIKIKISLKHIQFESCIILKIELKSSTSVLFCVLLVHIHISISHGLLILTVLLYCLHLKPNFNATPFGIVHMRKG